MQSSTPIIGPAMIRFQLSFILFSSRQFRDVLLEAVTASFPVIMHPIKIESNLRPLS